MGDALLELFGSLSVPFARGFEIADADLKSLALGFALGGLGLPGVPRADEFGDEDARGGAKRQGGNGLLRSVHGGVLPEKV